jgi:hypothetical protein
MDGEAKIPIDELLELIDFKNNVINGNIAYVEKLDVFGYRMTDPIYINPTKAMEDLESKYQNCAKSYREALSVNKTIHSEQSKLSILSFIVWRFKFRRGIR